MKMNLFTCLVLALIYKISATNINGKYYKMLKDATCHIDGEITLSNRLCYAMRDVKLMYSRQLQKFKM